MTFKPKRLTNGLIRQLNKACIELRNAGKCTDACECFHIGWCNAAWSIANASKRDTPSNKRPVFNNGTDSKAYE